MRVRLLEGDSLKLLQGLPDDSVDSVVTDPPYGLEFMGAEWDGSDGFRRSLNAADAGRESVFGRTSQTSPEYRTGEAKDWRDGSGFTKPGIGDRPTAWPSFSGNGANASCATCGGRQRGDKLCTCDSPDWRIKGQPFDPDAQHRGQMNTFQAFCEAWARECLRVLKPGGFLLAFGGTRTYHRLACGVEDAGFEVRDMIDWLYGTGFPKSLDVSKAIDKQRDDVDDVRVVCRFLRSVMAAAGVTSGQIAQRFGFHSRMVDHWAARDTDSQPTCPTCEQWLQLKELLPCLAEPSIEAEVWRLNGRKGTPGEAWVEREVVGEAVMADTTKVRAGFTGATHSGEAAGATRIVEITKPKTEAAQAWEGWGTALKPGHEPIVVARKPLARKNVAQNVLAFGTGALNIDACRVEFGSDADKASAKPQGKATAKSGALAGGTQNDNARAEFEVKQSEAGRWPANVIFSHSDECRLVGSKVVKSDGHHPKARGKGGLSTTGHGGQGDLAERKGPEQVDVWECAPGCPVAELDHGQPVTTSPGKVTRGEGGKNGRYSPIGRQENMPAPYDTGGPSRFFYVAKPGRAERDAGLDELAARRFARTNPGGLEHDPRWAPTQVKNHHPTVKPIELMRWLQRLVTPSGGLTLDLFNGSGTSGCAAVQEGFDYIGCDNKAEYLDIAERRIRYWAAKAGVVDLVVERGPESDDWQAAAEALLAS